MTRISAITKNPELTTSAQLWSPHKYQEKAIKFLLERGAAGLFLEPGLGKSACVLGAVKILLRRKLISRVLIVAPLRVCYSVWPEEIKKWADFNGLRYEILHGDKKDYAVQRDADIYIINPDGLEWLLTKHIVNLAPDMLVIDESTLIKHSRTKRFKLLKPLFPTFRRRVILTGTPVPNGYL